MATLNDFKLLKKKCENIFEVACKSEYFSSACNKLNTVDKERFGFYYFIIQQTTDLVEYEDMTEIICDQDFNSKIFSEKYSDEGIDVVYINEETHEIYLYNFKYRENFNLDKEQNKNEALLSEKFLAAIKSEKTSSHKGKVKFFLDKIIERLKSNEVWSIVFYIVSNENIPINTDDCNLANFKSIYGVEIKTISLDEIVRLMSIRPEKINSTLLLPKESAMSFSEDNLSSNKSFMVCLSLTELIRITCDDDRIRNKYDIEDEEQLYNMNIDYNLLFDNVRGLILKSKYNHNIESTLNDSPSEFFFYNNGITIVAEDIISDTKNGNKKLKLEIKNFQVLNGGQTLRTIHNFNKQDKKNIVDKLSVAQILVRILKVTNENLKNRISEYTNSQNAISLIDLRSIRTEQIRLEQYLAEHNLLYIRKKGDTGNLDIKNYRNSIGIERLGQILLAELGKPEETSNHKQEIFNGYYDNLFTNNEKLINNKTINLINKYYKINETYRNSKYKKTLQKVMYIVYISCRLNSINYLDIIKNFELFLLDYKKKYEIDTALSRILISNKFKINLDLRFNINEM